MPIYEYACEKCGKVVEQIQKVSDAGPKKCEHCGGKMARVMSRSSFQLKGGGWYKDLYSSTPAKKDGSPENKSSSETKGSADSGSKETAGNSTEKKAAPAEAKSSSEPAPKESKAKDSKPAKPAAAKAK